MGSLIMYNMIERGSSSTLIKRLYHYVKDKPFTFKSMSKKLPHLRSSMITAMHNTNIIRLLNGKKRAIGISKKNPSVWVFTTEALILLSKYNPT